MYTEINFRTKKELKEAVEAYNEAQKTERYTKSIISPITFYQPGPFSKGDERSFTGTIYLEEPHYPEAHRWYAKCQAENGIIVKVL